MATVYGPAIFRLFISLSSEISRFIAMETTPEVTTMSAKMDKPEQSELSIATQENLGDYGTVGALNNNDGYPSDPLPTENESNHVPDDQSPGVVRIENLTAHLTRPTRVSIFLSLFLVGYAFGLDAFLRSVYQTYATASYQNHSLLSTVNVLRTVFAAAAQPTAAKLADVFGRIEILTLSVVFYIVGTIVQATSTNLPAFSAGAILYQLGFTIIQVLAEIIIADITSSRARLVATFIPNLHFIITAWVSGNITSAVLSRTTWQWGVGMWCIIFTVSVTPLIVSLYIADRHARRVSSVVSPARRLPWARLFWQLDTPGIILLIASLALLLTPLTIAGGITSEWQTAPVIAPLVIGFLCIPAFVIWQLRAPHPLLPFSFLRDRGVWSPLLIAMLMNLAYAMQADFLYTVLIVAFDFSVMAATRITTLYLFTSFLVGPIVGLVVYRVRHLKYFIVAGTVLFFVGFGLLIRYRGDAANSSRAGVIGAQVVMGLAGGLAPYAALTSLQVSLQHEQLAVMTGLFLASHSIGDALGNCVSGAIWTQVLPSTLASDLAFQPDATLSVAAYADPFSVVARFPVGTPVRDAIIASYKHVQLLLCITGLCFSIPLIGLAFCLRSPRLSNAHTLAHTSK
jgi:SIT family siderophore-iron:H+ symporter-like MFS transporter